MISGVMKNLIRTFGLVIIICLFPLFLVAQTPPHPNGGEDPATGGNTPVGGAAPVGSGLVVLMALGMSYASRKVYYLNKSK